MVTVLRIDAVEKHLGSFHLGPLSLDVAGEVLAVLGPSGCGKTTLLSLVAGLLDPDTGEVSLGGAPLNGRPPEDRGTALVFQDGALFPHMTARENIAYAGASPDRVASLAETLEVADALDRPADALSGGQGQRVALARALAADPDALLLDEPLSNLDEPIRRRLRETMRDRLAALDIPVLYVTHDQRAATAVGDRVAVMGDGRLHQVGPPDDVFERPATPFVASFTGATNVFEATVVARDGGMVLEWGEHRLRIADAAAPVGEGVQFCVRPEYVALDPDGGDNVLTGRLVRRAVEARTEVLAVALDGVDATVEATRLPAVDESPSPEAGDRVEVRLPPGAIHVIG